MTKHPFRQRLSARVFLVLVLHAAVFVVALWFSYGLKYEFTFDYWRGTPVAPLATTDDPVVEADTGDATTSTGGDETDTSRGDAKDADAGGTVDVAGDDSTTDKLTQLQVVCQAMLLKLNATHAQTFVLTMPAIVMIQLIVFYALGNCHGWWRYVSFSDLASLLWSSLLSLLIIVAMDRVFGPGRNNIGLSVLAMDCGITIMLLGGIRSIWRLSREQIRPALLRKNLRPAFIVGATQTGESIARQLQSDPNLKYTIVGYLDADTSRHGLRFAGVPVLGHPIDAARLASTYDVKDVLVISSVLSGKQLRELLDDCEKEAINVRVIPSFDELMDNRFNFQVRDVDIGDLLRRDPVQLSNDKIESLLEGGTVMVTGAGGSIGSEICRQVLAFHPTKLLMVERTENALFLIERELDGATTDTQIVPCIADIMDHERLNAVFSEHRPDVVFHAAAHKHVPMMEHNPGEAIKNNVLGTRMVAEMADAHDAKEFVMISTDKAVNPTSVMGSSKHLAERFVHTFSEVSKTKFVVVRFGNVLGSNGSVVPIFSEQIRRGGPITVTHPDIERFFMTIPEASQLVLQAAAMGDGGEIFVLDMGEPVKIVDLARDMIRLSGLQSDDVEIVFTGLRPGEKLYEELYFASEEMLPTPHPKVFVAYHRPFEIDEVRASIDSLAAIMHGSAAEVRAELKRYIPEYATPADTNVASETS